MNSKLMKGLLLMLSSVFVAIQAGDIVWASTILTAVCIGVGYFAKNVWFESASIDNVFDWRDVASALILAVVAAVGESVGQIVVEGKFEINQLISVIGATIFVYFNATFFPSSKK